jgi:eukaryotic-like serine/threonine-protein kinase
MKQKVILLIALFLLFFTVPLVKADWPMFHADPAHSGVGTGNPVLTPILLWKFTTSDSINYSPVVANGIVYICSYDGNLYALNAKTGERIWNYNATELGIGSSPTVADGIVYVGSGDQNRFLYAFDAYSGVLLWTDYVGGSVTTDPTIVNGVIYLAADSEYDSSNCVLAINAKTGVEIWNYSSPNRLGCTPAVVNGVVYTASGGGYLHAINAANGEEIWNSRNGAQFITSPTVVNGIFYVGVTGAGVGTNGFYALNANSGEELWKYTVSDANNYFLSTAAVYDGTVYVGSRNGDVYAFNAAKGTLLWHIMAGHFLFSSPAVIQGIVYIGSGDGNFYAIKGTDGTILWKYTINALPGNFVYSSPAYDNGALYIGSCDNNLYAFGDYTGPTPTTGHVTTTANPPSQHTPTLTLEPESTLNKAIPVLQLDDLILLIAIITTVIMLLTAISTVLRKRQWNKSVNSLSLFHRFFKSSVVL